MIAYFILTMIGLVLVMVASNQEGEG